MVVGQSAAGRPPTLLHCSQRLRPSSSALYDITGANTSLCDILDHPPQHYVGEETWDKISKEDHTSTSSSSSSSTRSGSIPASYPQELLGSEYSTVSSSDEPSTS